MTDAAGRSGVLVISTKGLQQFVPALGALAAIRAYHRHVDIVLLTTRGISAFAATAPYLDDIWVDESDGALTLASLRMLRRQLRSRTFERVYDLDATPHSRKLFWLMYGLKGFTRRTQIPWCGDLAGTALAHSDPQRAAMHQVDRWSVQLKAAGVGAVPRPDMSWVARQVQSFTVPFRMNEPFVMIAPAPGPGIPWPVEQYGELAQIFSAEGQRPVIVGADVPPDIVNVIRDMCPEIIDLSGRATLNELVFLAWAATAAAGPDNGIMHLAAAAGCRAVVLYNNASDPALVGQRGRSVQILRRSALQEISADEVAGALGLLRK